MRLLCADILHTLRHKPIMIALPPSGEPYYADVTDPLREKIVLPLLGHIHQSQKFIFDSGSDQDERTTLAVRETTVNMIEAGLFHLPHPIIWVEDPYEENPEHYRNFYLAMETSTQIEIWFFAKLPMGNANLQGKRIPSVYVHPMALVIDLEKASDMFMVSKVDHVTPLYSKILGEAVYAFKKLLVTLNAQSLSIDKVSARKDRGSGPRNRSYDHSIVRIPLDTPTTTSSSHPSEAASDSSIKRRKHLVRGFVWGKNTRPTEQQHWVRPYWRGNETALNERSHYVVE